MQVYGTSECRTVLDATELRCERASCLELARAFWSTYKHSYTVKGLGGITPNGAAIPLSSLFPGRISDPALVEHSGFLEKVEAGDVYPADKGFLISDLLRTMGARVLYPPKKTRHKKNLDSNRVQETMRQANLRVHVERAFGRLKRYGWLAKPISMQNMDIVSTVFEMCMQHTNFLRPLCPDPDDDRANISACESVWYFGLRTEESIAAAQAMHEDTGGASADDLLKCRLVRLLHALQIAETIRRDKLKGQCKNHKVSARRAAKRHREEEEDGEAPPAAAL